MVTALFWKHNVNSVCYFIFSCFSVLFNNIKKPLLTKVFYLHCLYVYILFLHELWTTVYKTPFSPCFYIHSIYFQVTLGLACCNFITKVYVDKNITSSLIRNFFLIFWRGLSAHPKQSNVSYCVVQDRCNNPWSNLTQNSLTKWQKSIAIFFIFLHLKLLFSSKDTECHWILVKWLTNGSIFLGRVHFLGAASARFPSVSLHRLC